MSPLIVGATVALLGIFSAWVVCADPAADYPLGDGGLFYVIIKQILSGHFAYPQTIGYNGYQIPFAYSPLVFYCVAGIVKLAAIPIGKAMNLWVIVWSVLFAPAAYVAARRFVETDVEALVATGFTIVFPPLVAWLAMGGGVTRAPGFTFFLLASGFTWEAFRKKQPLPAVIAGVCAAAALWVHMEFAFIYAATFVIFVFFARPPVRIAGIIVGVAVLLALPWVLIAAEHFHAAREATRTTHGAGSAIEAVFYFSGIESAAWLPLTGFLCMLAASFLDRYYLLLVWSVAIVYLDNRAGFQAAHFPAGLAIAWATGKLWRSNLGTRLGALAFVLLLTVAFLSVAASTRDDSSRYVRISDQDVVDMTWMASHLNPGSDILTLNPTAFGDLLIRDQTFEWVPALSGLQSPITYQGLEWVSSQQTIDRNVDFFELQWCLAQGAECIRNFVHRKFPDAAVYAYVPAHGRAYPVLIAALSADSHFKKIYESSTSSIFKVASK